MGDNEDRATIGMLLDIEHLYGQHEGRTSPVLLTLMLILSPILLYIYFGAYMFIPIWLFSIVWVFFAIRIIMIIPGRESARVAAYKRQLNDTYMSTADLLNVKTIHEDGCIEYVNGRICYLVSCFNGTSDDKVQRSIRLRKMLESMIGDYEFDTYIYNVNDVPALRAYYDKVSNFERNESASNFVKMIDHNIELTSDTSTVQCTVYAVKGFRSDWKIIKSQIDSTLSSRLINCYKHVSILSEVNAVNEILNRDIDSIINIPELLRRKYSTGQYGSSKVLMYDLPDDMELSYGRSAMVTVVEDVAPTKSFHVSYKEGRENESVDQKSN